MFLPESLIPTIVFLCGLEFTRISLSWMCLGVCTYPSCVEGTCTPLFLCVSWSLGFSHSKYHCFFHFCLSFLLTLSLPHLSFSMYLYKHLSLPVCLTVSHSGHCLLILPTLPIRPLCNSLYANSSHPLRVPSFCGLVSLSIYAPPHLFHCVSFSLSLSMPP